MIGFHTYDICSLIKKLNKQNLHYDTMSMEPDLENDFEDDFEDSEDEEIEDEDFD
jgi:hypothetical protein